MTDPTESTVTRIVVRFLGRAALIVLFLYMGFCAYLYFDQRHLIYFPEYARTSDDTNFSLRNGNVVLRGWALNPAKANALLYFGGNAEDVGAERSTLAAMFSDRAVFLLPYRGYGPNAGEPDETANLSDALALYDYVHSSHARIAAVGRSLGSGVASYLASRRPVEKLALITPFDSLTGAAQVQYPVIPVSLLLKDRYESAHYLRRYPGPILILRAGHDAVVPLASTDRLINALTSKPQVITFPEAGHNSISDAPAYAKSLSQFIH